MSEQPVIRTTGMGSAQARPPLRNTVERNKLIEQWIPLAWWEVRRFFKKRPGARRLYDRDTAFSDAVDGLRRAAELFDESKGCHFNTYAVHWMRQSIGRGYQKYKDFIHIPSHRPPSDYKIVFSLFGLRCDRNGRRIDPDPVDPSSESAAVYCRQQEIREAVERCLNKIGARRAEILSRRMRGETLKDVAKSLGISRERVRQLQAQAMQQIRPWLIAEKALEL